MVAHTVLRAATAWHHAKVDASFAKFDLHDVASYRAFLTAHAKAVMPLEARLGAALDMPPWRPRLQLLEEDLAKLGAVLPAALRLDGTSTPGNLHGLLYVIEGSRLGGGMLAAKVGTSFPAAYLSAVHEQGEWRLLLATIDARAAVSPSSWMDDALIGAARAFELYEEAAALA